MLLPSRSASVATLALLTVVARPTVTVGWAGRDRGGGAGPATYLLDTDGSGLVRLTDDEATPAWSPDGSGVVFFSSVRTVGD